jgi:poly(hydroxyalkanoate) granule-associated protein
MATKNTNKAGSKDESSLKGMASKIMESGQQIWLAGLGAFAKAQEEGGKLYDSLVKEGSALEKITSKYTSAKVSEVRGAVENTVNQVKDRATDTLSKLEKVFEDRVSGALGALGIPGREELNELSRKVDELNLLVKGLNTGKVAPAAKAKAASPLKKVQTQAKKLVKKVEVKAKSASKTVKAALKK